MRIRFPRRTVLIPAFLISLACPPARAPVAAAGLPGAVQPGLPGAIQAGLPGAVPEELPGAVQAGYPGAIQEEAREGKHLYKVALIRAAPGRLPALIELLKEERDILRDAGEPLPFWMRHTQGDQWDLMVLYPMGSFYEYYEPRRTRDRNLAGEQKGLSFQQLQFEAGLLTSYREEVFVRGPDPEILERLFSRNDFYHAEMFVALPGRRAELLEERRMENRYLKALGRPENLIFVREAGGPWDSFTLGFFQDLQHFARASGLGSAEEREKAAVDAGFEGAEHIGNYMRRLILYHRDTLAVSIPWP
ncbi:MAG: hypothetical protein R6T96_01055 [Longimicrobiales bacterium]